MRALLRPMTPNTAPIAHEAAMPSRLISGEGALYHEKFVEAREAQDGEVLLLEPGDIERTGSQQGAWPSTRSFGAVASLLLGVAGLLVLVAPKGALLGPNSARPRFRREEKTMPSMFVALGGEGDSDEGGLERLIPLPRPQTQGELNEAHWGVTYPPSELSETSGGFQAVKRDLWDKVEAHSSGSEDPGEEEAAEELAQFRKEQEVRATLLAKNRLGIEYAE